MPDSPQYFDDEFLEIRGEFKKAQEGCYERFIDCTGLCIGSRVICLLQTRSCRRGGASGASGDRRIFERRLWSAARRTHPRGVDEPAPRATSDQSQLSREG